MAITLERIDPTVFNFLSDLVSLLIRRRHCAALPSPDDMARAAGQPHSRGGSWDRCPTTSSRRPNWLLGDARLVAEPDFAAGADRRRHRALSLADLGLDFVAVDTEGPPDTVLSLHPGNRNPWRLIQTAGDPLHVQTFPSPVTGFRDALDSVESSEALRRGRQQYALASSFLDAVELIARGGSPFVQQTGPTNFTRKRMDWEGAAPNVLTFYREDGGPLARMPLEIPLNCSGSDMERMEFGFSPLEAPDRLDAIVPALVPNCTFTGPSQSGIYEGAATTSSSGEATILETAELGWPFIRDAVFLKTGTGDLTQEFVATPEMKRLATVGEDWRRGREISNSIHGLQAGNLSIDFGAVVWATGVEESAIPTPDNEWDRHNEYGMVGQMLGDCPPRPSGLSSSSSGDDLSCLAIMTLSCQSFQEDYQLISEGFAERGLNDPTNSTCLLISVEIVWGTGLFVADAELATVVGGIYGRVRPNPFNGRAQDNFMVNSIFAAMFAVATLDERPSTNQVVRPRIGVLYVTVTLLPLAITAVVLIVYAKAHRAGLPIPRSAWASMVLGREEEKVPKRNSDCEAFPPKETAGLLALALVGDGGAGGGSDRCKLGVEEVSGQLRSSRRLRFSFKPPSTQHSSSSEQIGDPEQSGSNEETWVGGTDPY